MLDALTIIVPGLAGAAAFVLPQRAIRRWLLAGAALLNVLLARSREHLVDWVCARA